MRLRMPKNNSFKQILSILKPKNISSPWIASLKYFIHSEKKCRNNFFINTGVLSKVQFNAIKYLYFSENTSGVCSETLDSLSEYFEELIESVPHLKNADVTYSDGVLTVYFGQKHGTYVINRQTPNLQIWLSSPTSGPKRYDFINGTWVYKHDNTTLHSLLDKEIKEIINQEVEFAKKCLHANLKSNLAN